jgi:outer membrane protein assembly factor BamB
MDPAVAGWSIAPLTPPATEARIVCGRRRWAALAIVVVSVSLAACTAHPSLEGLTAISARHLVALADRSGHLAGVFVLTDSRLYRVSPTGSITWSTEVQDGTDGPAVAGRVVVASVQQGDAVIGCDVDSGRQVWHLGRGVPAWDALGGRAFGVVGTPRMLYLAISNHVVGIDPDTGRIRWTHAGAGPDPGHPHLHAIVPTPSLLIANGVPLEPETGRELSGLPSFENACGMDATSDTVVVADASGTVRGLDASSLAEKWIARTMPSGDCTVTTADAVAAVVMGGRSAPESASRVFLLDLPSGAARWDRPLPPSQPTPRVTMEKTTVLAASDARTGLLVAFDARTGKPQWTRTFGRGNGLNDAFLLVGETILVETKGDLISLARSDGQENWRAALDGVRK